MTMRLSTSLPLLLLAAGYLCAAKNTSPVVWNNEAKELALGISHHILESEVMGRSVGYTIALPKGYENSTRRFPVLYFLHGYGGDETSDGASVANIAKSLVADENAPAVICVFPNGGRSAYRDHPETGVMVETMICEELISHIDTAYRTLPHRESRAISGFSMGGNGAIRLALVHPDLFSSAASWAASMTHPWGSQDLPPELSAETLRKSELPVQLLMITGCEDSDALAAEQIFLRALTKARYPFTYRTLPGVNHNLGLYYQHSGTDFVRFLIHRLKTDHGSISHNHSAD